MLHFAVLGAVLIAGYRWVSPPEDASRRIVVTEALLRGLRQEHVRRTGVAPTGAEEAALIQRYLDDEVLYREALALGLDRGDVIVRRRLVQKMEFLNEGSAPGAEPTEADLVAWLAAHPDQYGTPARVSLVHVFASGDRHGDGLTRVATTLRDALGRDQDPDRLGDPFLRGHEFRQQTREQLAAVFGPEFAASVMALPVGGWSEPVRSTYGLHVVRVTERLAPRKPGLDEVRAAVERDWRAARRSRDAQEAHERLRRRYEIRVER